MSSVQENYLSPETQGYVDSAVWYGKAALNVADYLPIQYGGSNISATANHLRAIFAISFACFAIAKYGYNGLYNQDKNAREVFDKEIVAAANHMIRAVVSRVFNEKLLANGDDSALASSMLFFAYDAYANQDKQNKLVNYYA